MLILKRRLWFSNSGPSEATGVGVLPPIATHAAATCYVRLTSIVFSNGSRGERLFGVSTLSGACVLCVLVRHLMG